MSNTIVEIAVPTVLPATFLKAEVGTATAIFIVKFLTQRPSSVSSDRMASKAEKVATTRHFSLKTIQAIPYLGQQIGSMFPDAVKPAPYINVVDLVMQNINLNDLIAYFKVKKLLSKGKVVTVEAFRGLAISTASNAVSEGASDASVTSVEGASSSSSTTSLTRREREAEEERVKQEKLEQEEQEKRNPRLNLQGFFRLCDFFIDHDVIKIASKFATEYEDFAILSDDFLSDIASTYLDDVFNNGISYRSVIHGVCKSVSELRRTYEQYLYYLLNTHHYNVLNVQIDPAQIENENEKEYRKTCDAMQSLIPDLISRIDQLIQVVQTQGYNYLKRHGLLVTMNLPWIRGSESITVAYSKGMWDFVGGYHNICGKYKLGRPQKHCFSNKSSNPLVSSIIDRYVLFLGKTKQKINNMVNSMPVTAFLAPETYLEIEDDEDVANARIDSLMIQLNEVDAAMVSLETILRAANQAFAGSNIFDPNIHFTDRVISFVLQSPAIAKIIWETESLRRMLVLSYMKIPNAKQRRYMNGAFEELIPLTQGRIAFSHPNSKNQTGSDKKIWTDPQLLALYKKYNEWNYRYTEIENLNEHGVDALWQKIQDRTKFLTDKIQADMQKNAPRGPVKAGWFM